MRDPNASRLYKTIKEIEKSLSELRIVMKWDKRRQIRMMRKMGIKSSCLMEKCNEPKCEFRP